VIGTAPAPGKPGGMRKTPGFRSGAGGAGSAIAVTVRIGSGTRAGREGVARTSIGGGKCVAGSFTVWAAQPARRPEPASASARIPRPFLRNIASQSLRWVDTKRLSTGTGAELIRNCELGWSQHLSGVCCAKIASLFREQLKFGLAPLSRPLAREEWQAGVCEFQNEPVRILRTWSGYL
jgi:hypothetical protein